MRPAYWAAAAFSRRCRQQSHGTALSSFARLLGGAVGLSGRRPRVRRLSQKCRRRSLGAPLGSRARLGAVGISGGRPRLRRRRSPPWFSGAFL